MGIRTGGRRNSLSATRRSKIGISSKFKNGARGSPGKLVNLEKTKKRGKRRPSTEIQIFLIPMGGEEVFLERKK